MFDVFAPYFGSLDHRQVSDLFTYACIGFVAVLQWPADQYRRQTYDVSIFLIVVAGQRHFSHSRTLKYNTSSLWLCFTIRNKRVRPILCSNRVTYVCTHVCVCVCVCCYGCSKYNFFFLSEFRNLRKYLIIILISISLFQLHKIYWQTQKRSFHHLRFRQRI
jgi:hypothetical protein